MKARIKWTGDRTFLGESGTGHTVPLGTTKGPDGR
ncbi:MAG: osmotically inducible protein C, partial [Alphaproteobacteria bacterium]|nr:osmotically inducible protein C [Alphaproteobacteria bacterium]